MDWTLFLLSFLIYNDFLQKASQWSEKFSTTSRHDGFTYSRREDRDTDTSSLWRCSKKTCYCYSDNSSSVYREYFLSVNIDMTLINFPYQTSLDIKSSYTFCDMKKYLTTTFHVKLSYPTSSSALAYVENTALTTFTDPRNTNRHFADDIIVETSVITD